MAPEGKISKTGGLLPGHPGIGHLAAQAAAPIVPLVMYGHERPFHNWLRLRRAPVHVRIGKPIQPPAPRPTSKQLESYRDTIMMGLARMLPPEYQGAYRRMCE